MKIDKSEIYETAFQIASKNQVNNVIKYFDEALDYVYNKAMKDGMDIIHELLDLDNETIEDIFKNKFAIDIIKKSYTIFDINDKIENINLKYILLINLMK